jgi:branched-chain amino acid transport system substrate-binding protein
MRQYAKKATGGRPENEGARKGSREMKPGSILLAALAAWSTTTLSAAAEDKVKVGLIVTLSGPPAVLGGQVRDGFNLAVKTLGGKLGGLDAEVTVVDDELKPDVAVTKVKGLLERDQVNFVVGPVFSNVLQAIHKPVTESNAFLISPNAGTSNFAGKQCNPNFFVTSYQNDQVHEVLGKYAQDKGYKSAFLLAPNYQAGKDALAGFKRDFKGEIVDEVYTPLGQLDFSAELAKIAADKPEAFFTFMPGGMGVNLVKQYRQARLASIPFLSAFTADESTLPAEKDDALGFLGGANWAPDMDNPQSRTFVKAYEAAYNSVPGTYAMQAYDAALLIDSAIKATGGKLSDKDALRSELKKANFASLRGKFKFGVNHYPIQDFYLVKAARRPDGKYETEIVQRVFEDYVDRYAPECMMK